jgi:hypothetical protein
MLKIRGRLAMAAGFNLIRREPVAFLAWCGLVLFLGVAPQALTFGSMVQSLAVVGSGGTAAEIMAAQQGVMRFMPLYYLCGFAILLLLPPAIFRAVLRPEEGGFMFIRLGAAEWWFFLVVFVYFIAYFIGFLVIAIPWFLMIGLGALLAQMGPAGALAIVPLLLFGAPALMGLLVWWLLKWSMAPLMAFGDRTFRFTESWKLTRKQTWKMFLVALVLTAISGLAYLLVFGGLLLALGLDLQSLARVAAAGPGALVSRIGLPWIVVGVLAYTVLTTAYYVLWAAAWAEMYRQLNPNSVAETFD